MSFVCRRAAHLAYFTGFRPHRPAKIPGGKPVDRAVGPVSRRGDGSRAGRVDRRGVGIARHWRQVGDRGANRFCTGVGGFLVPKLQLGNARPRSSSFAGVGKRSLMLHRNLAQLGLQAGLTPLPQLAKPSRGRGAIFLVPKLQLGNARSRSSSFAGVGKNSPTPQPSRRDWGALLARHGLAIFCLVVLIFFFYASKLT